MKAAFMRTVGAAMRMSEASASANPPPEAAPLISATIGCGQRRIARMISAILRWKSKIVSTSSPELRSKSLISSPAQNARPAPVNTTTRTDSSNNKV